MNPVLLTLGCLASVVCLLLADRKGISWGRVFAKLAASTLFVWLALALGALDSRYGQLLLVALLLGWLGDALLLSTRAAAFLAGLAAFLASHGFFAAAFLLGPTSYSAIGLGALVAIAVGLPILRWLLPHVAGEMRRPVWAYVLVILVMCVCAGGFAAATGHWFVLAGALLFAASDIAVARERFVQKSFVNQLWGWPTYYVAQLLLAWSVAVVRP